MDPQDYWSKLPDEDRLHEDGLGGKYIDISLSEALYRVAASAARYWADLDLKLRSH